jgi:hypothetical protein
MEKNLDLAAQELFAKLRSTFPKVSLKDAEGNPTDEEKLARQFDFEFKKNNISLGSIRIDLTEEDGLTVMFSNDVIKDQSSRIKTIWFNFIEELRKFAKQKILNFEVRDLNLTNIQKRGDSQMTESKLQGSLKTSYQDLGETKLIIRHTQPINPNIPAGRTMHIESIYIENAQGERFKYPMRHINGARAMAEHIRNGGIPYDDIGQYIVSLSEELSNLRKFKGYVGRTPVVSEAMSDITVRVIERIEEVKKEINQLQKHSYYQSFSESFTKSEVQEIPEDIINDWVDRLTIKTFNEELKGVFPYIYKIVGQDIDPIKEMNFDEFVSVEETGNLSSAPVSIEKHSLDVEQQFENYLNKILGEGPDIFSNNQEEQSVAIEKLNSLLAQEFPVGTDGTNAIESLSEIIDDKELVDVFKELADINPDSDVRNIIKDYVTIKDQENGTDVLSKLNFSAEPAPEPTAEPAPAAPPPEAAAPAVPPSMPTTPGVAMAENIKRVVERAKRAGMTAEDTFTLFGEEVSLADAIQRAGLNVNEFFDQGYADSGDEVVEFVKSMFDENGNTPKGPTGVLISVEKKFGEEALGKAKHIMNELMTQAEMRRIQELSGLGEVGNSSASKTTQTKTSPSMYDVDKANRKEIATQFDPKSTYVNPHDKDTKALDKGSKAVNTKDDFEEGFGDDLAYKAGSAVGKVQKGVRDTVGNIRQGVSDLATNFQAGQQAGQQGTLRDPGPGPGSFQTPDEVDPESSQKFPIDRGAFGKGYQAPKKIQPPPKMGQGGQPQPKPQSGQMAQPKMGPGITKQDRNLRSLESSELAAMLRIAGLK